MLKASREKIVPEIPGWRRPRRSARSRWEEEEKEEGDEDEEGC